MTAAQAATAVVVLVVVAAYATLAVRWTAVDRPAARPCAGWLSIATTLALGCGRLAWQGFPRPA